jgi:ATP-dependent helicase HrpB
VQVFETSLPIDTVLGELCNALRQGTKAVLVAPPGAGKTTRVPLALLDEPWVAGRKIILLEPRRLAARGAAARMAETLGEEAGATVGIRVRMGSKISKSTRIEVVTEGVFARMVLDDPELNGIAAVLFDEFHERSLDADLGLALALDAQAGLREDLRVLVMSATIDDARVAAMLDDCPVIASQGRAFPVETRYLGRDPARRIEDSVIDAVMRALSEETGSLLVFLPGQGEIRRVAERLNDRLGPAMAGRVLITPLYGAMERAEQDAAIAPAPAGLRKVVLATSVAETSLTIEGVRVVIDSGLARVPVYEPDLGLTRLETVRVSRAAADQRRGRAGRTEPGICYRLWEQAATGALSAFAAPEILAADLSGLLLDCAAWGVADPAQLRFLDAPPAPALNEARSLLSGLGALDADGRITPFGLRLRALPLPPRLAAMVLHGADCGAGQAAADIAAVIVERGLGGDGIDLSERLERFRRDRGPRANEMRTLAQGWARQAMGGPRQAMGSPSGKILAISKGDAPTPAMLLSFAYPDRIAKARGAPGTFLMANGRAASLPLHDALARSPFLAIAEVVGSAASGRIMLAAPMDLANAEAIGGDAISVADETFFDRTARALRARRIRRLGAIVLSEKPLPVSGDADAARTLAEGIAALGGMAELPWSKAQVQWRDRVAFLRKAEGAETLWPDVSDAELATSAADWLSPHLVGRTALSQITNADLDAALAGLLPWDMARRLEAEAPTHLAAPTGSQLAVDYAAEAGPTISVRVQELFGLVEHPALAGGRVPLVLELLSPAHRPIQVTRDLPGFWRGSWADVKRDMKARYPRHLWPDDPAAAAPTTRAKPRGT